ncbi:hypothetical protein MN032_16840 [Agromyces atrinae]|uniref:hypothetical protein n=1 Tax=Agromyces atrinae TaxID=592376 RepID=UPI001F57A3FF|nr:hypothetical protein [Agromyces atrinae]MCI2959356.1 hypothetical protein [Agromyces atrinae]
MTFLAPETRAALDALHALEHGEDVPDGIARLRGIRSLLAALDADPAALAAVRDALDSGSSWDEVSTAASLTPAAAKQRWAGDDAEIAARQEASRKRGQRPSSKPTDLPGLSVAEAAAKLGVTPQAIYLRVTRGQLRAETVELPDGRSYKRVFLDEPAESETS